LELFLSRFAVKNSHVKIQNRHHRRQRLVSHRGFTNQKWVKVKTPFGSPSDELLTGKLADATWFFSRAMRVAIKFYERTQSPRQHLGHEKARVAWIISVSAVGSLQAEYQPCDIVLPEPISRPHQARF